MPSSPSAMAEVYLPTYPPMDIRPLAGLGGRLVQVGGCLWFERDSGRALALWPPGTTIERDGSSLTVVDPGGARAVVGTNVVATGGAYGPEHYEMVVELIGEPVPEGCRGDDHYLLVYDARTTRE